MKHNDIKIGCHVSIAKSVDLAIDRALEVNGNTFQIFTKNPRGWAAKQMQEEEIQKFKAKSKKHNLSPIFGHISYLPNLASTDPEIYSKSLESFLNEIERCKILGVQYFVVHGGSYKSSSFEKGMSRYVESILEGINSTRGKVVILIENSSGGANSLTSSHKNISLILDEINDKTAVQVCFDTCHAFGSGYDLRDEKAVDATVDDIQTHFGFDNISLIHANDSIGELNSNRDRHQHLGLGEIGEKGFKALINNPNFKKKPWILETPINEIRGDSENIRYLHSLIRNENN
ncbi:MAG: deoxyribonuclease IV [Candidatus Heimdallarchaeota archaeon]|nr:deoxyribonuclease IV [Candidatus Heimdallarchaeota archaeon]